ncbi:hypothetical protein [Nannocystis sp.]|uniref:hypothetical protein n=1 Tax=Nannocystis sp. TaxID=1962667 RepID=UPI002427DB95|nr:hypothetical protein [Nannocystis sp.]MBK7827008.1 hypothetical protein [Nannocystis sp.]MBK9755970.1 hypothetical protein [Nannocystis sp.]
MLAVSSVAPACGGKDGTTTGSTGKAEATTEMMPTSTGTTGTEAGTAGSTSGELPDCRMYDGQDETCSSMFECIYLLSQDVCIVRCNYFHDQATCEMQEYCYWDTGGCYLAV